MGRVRARKISAQLAVVSAGRSLGVPGDMMTDRVSPRLRGVAAAQSKKAVRAVPCGAGRRRIRGCTRTSATCAGRALKPAARQPDAVVLPPRSTPVGRSMPEAPAQ